MRRLLSRSLLALAAVTLGACRADAPTAPEATDPTLAAAQGPQPGGLSSVTLSFKNPPAVVPAGEKVRLSVKATRSTLGVSSSASLPKDLKFTAYLRDGSARTELTGVVDRTGSFTAPTKYPVDVSIEVVASGSDVRSASTTIRVTPLPPITLSWSPATLSLMTGERATIKLVAKRGAKPADVPRDVVFEAYRLLPDGAKEMTPTAVNSRGTQFIAPAGLREDAQMVVAATSASAQAQASLPVTVLKLAPMQLRFTQTVYTVKGESKTKLELKAFRRVKDRDIPADLPADLAWSVATAAGQPSDLTVDSKGYFVAPALLEAASFVVTVRSALESTAAQATVNVAAMPPMKLTFLLPTVAMRPDRTTTLSLTATRDGRRVTLPADLAWTVQEVGPNGQLLPNSLVVAPDGRFHSPNAADIPGAQLTLRVTAKTAANRAEASTTIVITK